MLPGIAWGPGQAGWRWTSAHCTQQQAAAVEATHQRLLYAALQLPGTVHSWHAVATTAFSVPGCRSGRDPRFDDLTGTLDQDKFKNAYAFLYNEQLPEERQVRPVAAHRCCGMAGQHF